jgi:hypothetical protein
MTQLSTPSDFVKGAHIRLQPDPVADQQDWRVKSHAGLWEVADIKVDQRPFDDAPQTYVQLKSIERKGGVAFTTLPYNPRMMEVVFTPPEPVVPLFPEPGSKVYIKEGTDEKPSAKDGLWVIERAEMKKLESGRDHLHLGLKSEGRKNQSYLNIAFNTATMKPVMPENNDRKPNVEMQRKVNVFKPISFKK